MGAWGKHLRAHWALPASVLLHGGAVAAYVVQFASPAPSLPANNDAPSLVVEVMLLPVPAPDVVTTAAPPAPPPEPEPPPMPEVVEEPPPLIESVAEAPPAPPPPPEVKEPEPEPAPPRPIATRVPPKRERPPEPAPRPVEQAAVAPQPPTPVPAPPAQQTALAAPAGRAGPPPDYLSLIRHQLERHKVYPRAAQARRQQGRAMLRFVIDRDGNVVSHRLERSSGHPLLDREVEAMIERAAPLPPMPTEMAQARLELVVPVDFFLR